MLCCFSNILVEKYVMRHVVVLMFIPTIGFVWHGKIFSLYFLIQRLKLNDSLTMISTLAVKIVKSREEINLLLEVEVNYSLV